MRASDLLAHALGALQGDRKRTGFSLLGVTIGVASVLVLAGLGEGARGFLRQQFETIGTQVLGIVAGKVETSGGVPGFGGAPNPLTLDDAQALQREVSQARRVLPLTMGNETLAAGNRSRQAVVVGTVTDHLEVRSLEMRAGRFLPDEPWEKGSRVAVLGPELAKELFPGANPLGQLVRLGGWRMRVIGVLKSQGQRLGINMDDAAFVPVATAMSVFDEDSLFQIAVQAQPGALLDGVQERCARVLRARHGEEDFTITTPDAVLGSLDSIMSMLTLGLMGIAAISLLVAGVGIMNVMLVSVAERTEEIGLSKAVGAEPRQVLSLFLAEATLHAILGSAFGLALGYGALRCAAWLYPSFPFAAPWWSAFASVALALVVGIGFALWPATRALRLDPVEALTGRTR